MPDHRDPLPAPDADRERVAELLASDAERERVAESLRAHAADGRLDHDELEDRLGRAYGARTRGELAPLLADLPARPAPPVREPRKLPQISPVIAVSLLLLAIWALTGMGYFWPMWPIGAMVLSGIKHRGRHMPASRHVRAP